MKLYTYYRSGSAYRVRIALALKGLEYEPEYIVVRPDSPDLNNPAYVKLNPQRTSPTFVDGDLVLTQSLAIIEYLNEIHPEPPLLPKNPAERARIRKIALAIVADTHALNVQRVSKYMATTLGCDQPTIRAWRQHWMTRGLGIIETFLRDDRHTGTFCHGDSPTVADVILVPQVYTSQHYDVDLTNMPTVKRIYDHCLTLPAFQKAKPENQPDYNRDGRETPGAGH
jgi:maleylpyruvate isomerase